MLLMIDNYDSFTYNLVQLFQKLDQEVDVRYNDQITISEIRALNPTAIILSPGPCTPAESGICLDIAKELYNEFPILGVCLGHQVIGETFGATVTNATRIMHGKTDLLSHEEDAFFQDVPPTFTAARYHSLSVTELNKSSALIPLAVSQSDGTLMALRHKDFPVYGVQFHPESYASEFGLEIAKNFIRIASNHQR